MDVQLLEPRFLLLALVVVPAFWLLPRRATDARHALVRSLAALMVVLALAQPVLVRESAQEHHVLVVDTSPSVDPDAARDARDTALALAGRLARSSRTVMVEVGSAGEGDTDSSSVQRLAADGAGSPLAAALALAARTIPDGAPGAITLASDGRSTERDWGPVVQDLVARGLPVHTARLASVLDGDVYPVRLEPLEELRVGRTARLLVELVGAGTSLAVTLSGPEGELARIDDVDLDGRGAFFFEFEPDAAGFVSLAAEVHGAGGVRANDRLERTFAVQDPLRVLYLGERVAGGAARIAHLVGAGFTVDEGSGPTDAESDLSASYDLVVLDDRPAESVPEALQEELARAVREDGLGLLMSGGSAAFGPGGWHETPLATLLPVEFVQKEEKRDPSTTLVVIIDTSGSMGGNRVQLAKEVARLAIRRLLPHDKVGIVEFYGAKRWAAPVQPASNSIELERALNRLDAGGGTVILPAIEEAFYALQNVDTRYKHVLVLTDGGVETGAFEPLLRRMADKGMNVSTVLIGPEAHSEFLVTLANWGQGRFYSVPNRFNLPEILLKQPTSAKLPAYRPGTHTVLARGGAGWWGPVDPRAVPALAGYVETRARPGAQVVLETERGAHPVVATWRYGLGRVTAFTSEPTGPGTEPWRDWPGFGPWLARALQRTAADTRAPWAFDVERRGHAVIVRAERRRGESPPWARRLEEDGNEGAELVFRERAPGLFEARCVADPAREARFVAGAVGEPSVERLVCAPSEDPAAELSVDPLAALDLAALGAATGGVRGFAGADTGFRPPVGGGVRPVGLLRLAPFLLALALLLYLADIYYRRRGRRRRIA